MAEALSSIRLEMSDSGLATISLCQSERGNPFDGDFCRDFKVAMLDLWERPGVRAVLLRADGPNFSFGGDLKTFYPQRAELSKLVWRWTSDLHMGLSRAWHLPVPFVVAVQGAAMGGAVALLAGCDVVVAAESARFGSAFSQIGFSCDSGTSITLTARMGASRAKRFLLLGEMLTSAEALQSGLADQVVPDADLQTKALEIANRLAAGPTQAYGEIKRLFLRVGSNAVEAQLEDEALTLARVSASHDAQEGVAAFVERRKPVYKGR
jgi:2-(1,2-epoxy-1,2-dihydrophenyl)acetyl-CoA isomerase